MQVESTRERDKVEAAIQTTGDRCFKCYQYFTRNRPSNVACPAQRDPDNGEISQQRQSLTFRLLLVCEEALEKSVTVHHFNAL